VSFLGIARLCPILVGAALVLLTAAVATAENPYPPGSPAHVVPGQIQAEDYDIDGEGASYHDLSVGNEGKIYRPDDVDIKLVRDGSTVVGWFQKGEWLAYGISVAQDGNYDVRLRTGSAYTPTRSLIVAIDGTAVGQVDAPNIADWDAPLAIATLRGVPMTSGPHELRIIVGSQDWVDLDWIDIAPAAAETTPAIAAPAPALDTSCSTRLQALVDAAPAGSTLDVPPCVYRETVRISKSLTLDGHGQAEIRGSDVWSSWNRNGNVWVQGPVPALPTDGDGSHCQANTDNRCLRAEQVFVDGKPLAWAASNPKSGQFAVDGGRNIQLADDPTGHQVEVTTRQRWVDVQSDHVTLQGMTMRHSGSAPNVASALGNQGYSSFTVQDSVLSDAHGSLVSIDGGSDARLLRNDLSRAGQLGISGWNASGALIQNNRIHDNATDGYDWNWAAGGVKLVRHTNLTLDHNEVWSNLGPGLWCDIGCANVTISNNRAHDNQGPGVFYEVSTNTDIAGNVVWNSRRWPGILISSAANVNVHDNVLAWNDAGVAVWSNDRPDRPPSGTVGISVHNNSIIQRDMAAMSLEWTQYGPGKLFDAGSGNSGWSNQFWYPGNEDGQSRFAWQGKRGSLGEFNGTPGGRDGRYLPNDARDAMLRSAGAPASP
jgi:parallel beta-helix repeat protein